MALPPPSRQRGLNPARRSLLSATAGRCSGNRLPRQFGRPVPAAVSLSASRSTLHRHRLKVSAVPAISASSARAPASLRGLEGVIRNGIFRIVLSVSFEPLLDLLQGHALVLARERGSKLTSRPFSRFSGEEKFKQIFKWKTILKERGRDVE